MAMTAGDVTLKAIRDTHKISALLNGGKLAVLQSQAEEVKEEQLEEDSTPTLQKKAPTDETRA